VKIDFLLESRLRKSMLKRVRIKVDPTQIGGNSMEMCSSYEGYVLEESDTTVKVYLLNVPAEFNNIQTVDKKFVTPVTSPSPTFESAKSKLLSTLEKSGFKNDSPECEQIKQSNSIDFLESYLRQLGYNEEKLLSLYRDTLFA